MIQPASFIAIKANHPTRRIYAMTNLTFGPSGFTRTVHNKTEKGWRVRIQVERVWRATKLGKQRSSKRVISKFHTSRANERIFTLGGGGMDSIRCAIDSKQQQKKQRASGLRCACGAYKVKSLNKSVPSCLILKAEGVDWQISIFLVNIWRIARQGSLSLIKGISCTMNMINLQAGWAL